MSQLADAERKACIIFHLLDVRLLSKKITMLARAIIQ